MRNIRLGPVLVCSLLLGLCACGGQIRELENQTGSLQSDVRDVRSLQAQHTAAISELRTELRKIQGRLEELQYQAEGKTAQLERTLRQFGSRVPPPEGVPEDLLNDDGERIARNQGQAAEQFRMGLEQLRAGDFNGAKSTFTSFNEQYPETAFSDNALFWLGVSHEKLGQYNRAIIAYSDVFQRYPAEDRVPAALYRLAESFVKIDAKNDAVITLQKLIDEHPRSSYSSKARKRLKELKRRGRRRR